MIHDIKDVYYFIKHGYIEKVKNLVKQGVISIQDLMISSIHFGQLELVKFSLKKGADIRTHIDTYLFISVITRDTEMARFLLEQGANIHADNDKVLLRASKNRDLKMIKFLLEKGANNIDGALKNAALIPDIKIVKYLVEKWGANIYVLDNLKLQESIQQNNGQDILMYIESKGLKLKRQSKEFKIRIDPEYMTSNIEVLKSLLKDGYKIYNSYKTI